MLEGLNKNNILFNICLLEIEEFLYVVYLINPAY